MLRSALNLFREKGYSDTSIRDITEKAGVANSIIYHYFKDKEELLFEIVMPATTDLLRTLLDIDERIDDPLQCMSELIRAHVAEFGFKKPAKVVITDSFQLRGKHAQSMQKAQREIYDLYMRRLVQLKEIGHLREIDLTVASFSIFGMINSTFRWFKEGGRLSWDGAAQQIVQMAFGALLRDGCSDWIDVTKKSESE